MANKPCPYSPDDPVGMLPLIGPSYESKLERIGVKTIKDLLLHYPFRYEDTRNVDTIEQLRERGEGTVIATIDTIGNTRTRNRRFLTKATISDKTGMIAAIWFNQPYLTKTLKVGDKFLFNGKTSSKWGSVTFMNPQYEKAEDPSDTVHLGKISPVYPTTYGVSSKWIRSRIKPLEKCIETLIEEYLPDKIVSGEKLKSLPEAVRIVHFPDEEDDLESAHRRLGLDELIRIRIETNKAIAQRKKQKAINLEGAGSSRAVTRAKESLPFTLTRAQEQALAEILDDLENDIPMYRLLNGDVGSGKTIVALLAAIACHKTGYSTIIMAPTTILAQQHYQTVTETLSDLKLNIPISIYTAKDKSNLSLEPGIIIGTHALIYQDTLPDNIAFVVIDEQHRFGVVQRTKLLSLSYSSGMHPHYLTMTATPIPRTLTMALYGSTNVSVLDELPPGRIPIQTNVVPEKKRADAYLWIDEKIEQGDQVFVICPLVEDSEKIQAKAATEEYDRLRKDVFPNRIVGLIHGQMKEEEKTKTLNDFREKELNILVATPVIEVGIDIPNATVMVIEDSERFGLAQLHQFRGRIGRGQKKSYCFLFTKQESEDARDRLNYFAKHSNGFDVAEYDLKRRGPGEVYGIRQSGLLTLQFADISDTKQMALADRIASQLEDSVS